jgi:hypothetical protein
MATMIRMMRRTMMIVVVVITTVVPPARSWLTARAWLAAWRSSSPCRVETAALARSSGSPALAATFLTVGFCRKVRSASRSA